MNAGSPIPTIRGRALLASIFDMRYDRIRFLQRIAEEHGEVVRIRTLRRDVYITSSPDLVHTILVEKSAEFMKGLALSTFGKPLLGNGLLSSEGQFHRRQRRMIAPAFVQKRITEYAQVIVARTLALAADLSDGETLDVSAAMMRLTLEIVGKTLFDAEVGTEAAEIGRALEVAMEHVIKQLYELFALPPTWPTPARRKNQEAIRRLDETVYRLIRDRRAQGGDKGDFLSMLLLAQDEDDGSVMTDKQVRDEAMNIFLAGHETTANALAWTFYLLAQHPAARERLEREVDAALGERPPALADLARMPYTLQVFKESMRLYPPAHMIARVALRAIEIGAFRFPKGALILINIQGMHRRSALYPDPHRFDPERFTPQAEKSLPRLAYMPFSAGPRVCIGNHFALMEGHLALAALSQRARFDLLSGWRRVEPEALLTLRPRGGITMRVTRRTPATPQAQPHT